jgi:hypothetical protein
MTYTLFAETEALPPVVPEPTNIITGKFIIQWADLQIFVKLFCVTVSLNVANKLGLMSTKRF